MSWPAGEFEEFHRTTEPALRRALVARFGASNGVEATHLALVWAWEHHTQVVELRSPIAYLFRVGSSRLRRIQRVPDRPLEAVDVAVSDQYEDRDLTRALARLTERQRTVCVLVHGLGWSQADIAEGLGISASTVHLHLTTALQQLALHLTEEVRS